MLPDLRASRRTTSRSRRAWSSILQREPPTGSLGRGLAARGERGGLWEGSLVPCWLRRQSRMPPHRYAVPASCLVHACGRPKPDSQAIAVESQLRRAARGTADSRPRTAGRPAWHLNHGIHSSGFTGPQSSGLMVRLRKNDSGIAGIPCAHEIGQNRG